MPLTARVIKGKARVIEKDSGNIAMNASGTPIDGGGHANIKEAKAQATAVNLSQLRKKGKKIE